MLKYSRTTGNCYLVGINTSIPSDAVDLPEERFVATIGSPKEGKRISHDADGLPILIDELPTPTSVQQFYTSIDSAANEAHGFIAGGALRALEYAQTAEQAEAFADAGYPSDNIPPLVAAGAVNGRTPKEVADEIREKHAQYIERVSRLRTARLAGKEQVRSLIKVGEIVDALGVVEQTLAVIEEIASEARDDQE
ncbi:hypothetical protein [Pseudomonas sp. 18175]|uniref:hypothetical protein n=1 Tax=Pseudomonas sp. 18175 TaxID=3390056 RepID=UPI003D219955